MSAAATTPPRKVNRIGLDILPYKGGKTTLCAGCGHNAITERLIEAFFEMGVEPWSVAKFSGIGCSSKSPAYFLSGAHGFNGVHGRAPAIATARPIESGLWTVSASVKRTYEPSERSSSFCMAWGLPSLLKGVEQV